MPSLVSGPLRESLGRRLAESTDGAGRVDLDEADPDGQTLLVWYPEVEPRDGTPAPRRADRIRRESALDPNRPVTIRPYVAADAPGLDLTTGGVTTIDATRTFWGQGADRPWPASLVRAARRSAARRPASRTLLRPALSARFGRRQGGAGGRELGADCARHARLFFDRPDYDLVSAVPGTFAIAPAEAMVEALARDYANTTPMIFGSAPAFEAILASANEIEETINNSGSPRRKRR